MPRFAGAFLSINHPIRPSMFGSKNEEKKQKNGAPTPSTSSVNTLVQGTRVEGNITADHDIRIDGHLQGNLECKAKLIIGASGSINGDVSCTNAIIEGSFEGNLRVREVLNVKESAQVTGDVRTDKLIVHSGAVFNVTCAMGAGEKPKVVPATAKTEATAKAKA